MPSPFDFVTTVVLTDVRRRQGLVLALALAATGYLWLWFPPAELRATLHAARPVERALGSLVALAAYLRITGFASARVVASSEVMHLRHLPIASRTWQRTHAVHLAVLELPLAAVVAYALAPTWARARFDATAWWLATLCGAIAWRVAVLALRDRDALARTALVFGAAGAAWSVMALGSAAAALALAGLATSWSWRRLARPLPAASRRRTPSSTGGGPLGALVWLWLAVAWANDRAAILLVTVLEVLSIAAIALAWHHVGDAEGGNVTAAIALWCSLGVAPVLWLGLRNERRLALERHALDPLVGRPALDLVARMLAASSLALPMLVAWAALTVLGVPQPGAGVPLTIATVTLACGPAVVAASTHGQLHDRLQAPMVRAVATVMVLQALALTGLGRIAALAVAGAFVLWVWRRAPAAERVRQRRGRVAQGGDA